jgi:hypothetical protein
VTAALPSVGVEPPEVSCSRPEASVTDNENSQLRNVERFRHRVLNQQISDPESLGEKTIDRLLETFFTMWHPRWPVLHRPTFDWRTAPWHLVWVVCITAAKFQSRRSSLPIELQEEMAAMLKKETEETLDKGLNPGAVASVADPEFLPRMQTYLLYVLFLLFFGTDVEFTHANRVAIGIVKLLQEAGIFHHSSLHDEMPVGSLARVKQEGWKMFVPSMLKILRRSTDIAKDYNHCIPRRCLHIHPVQTEARIAIP